MALPEEDEDWTFISPQPTLDHVRNEQTQTEETTDSDIDILERFDLGAGIETESIVSDFSFLRSSDLQVETCDFSDDFPDEGVIPTTDQSPRPKAYLHIPNQSVNSQLTVILIMSVAAVAGLAVGNYLGWSRSPEMSLSTHSQLMKLKQLQEELSSCKEHQVDGMNSSCLVSNLVPKCNMPVISSAIINPKKLAPVQVRPSVALTHHVDHTAINPKMEAKIERKTSLEPPRDRKVTATVDEENSQHIIIETRKYFPLSYNEKEKLGVTLWILLSENGVSRPLFTAGLRRLQQIKESHLDPFIGNHFPKYNYKIWSEETGLSLVKADGSIRNLAKRSEMEKSAQEGATGRFWSKVMKNVYKRGKKFGSKLELEETITDVLSMMPREYFGHLWYGFEKKVAKLRGKRK